MIRVVRILEYTFSTPEVAERHLAGVGVPLTGTKQFGDYIEIRSAFITDFNHTPDEPTPTCDQAGCDEPGTLPLHTNYGFLGHFCEAHGRAVL